jgi:hypothetical protein
MKRFVPKSILDFLKWQKTKYYNLNKQKEKIIKYWNANGKIDLTPHVIKQNMIKYFKKEYSINIFIEAGTFMGEMVYAQRNNFEKII